MCSLGLMLVLQLALKIGLVLLASAAAAATVGQAKEGCLDRCGNVSIPYPFGTNEEHCYLSPRFRVTCNHFSDPPKLLLGEPFPEGNNTQVLNISLEGELRVLNYVSHDCYNSSGGDDLLYTYISRLWPGEFNISSTRNKFTMVGCDTFAWIEGQIGEQSYRTGCMSFCNNLSDVHSGSCSGNGCCQTSIPEGLSAINLTLGSFNNYADIWEFNPCGYAFVVEESQFNFSSNYLKDLKIIEELPMVFDWAFGEETCQVDEDGLTSYACKGNSTCNKRETGWGYLCNCSEGYLGNPYLEHGCQDIDECSTSSSPCNGTCHNLPGTFDCSCPKGYKGDGRKNGAGCTIIASQSQRFPFIILGTSITLLVILLTGSWVYLGLRERKLTKREEKFFKQNGGVMLQQLLAKYEGCTETTKIFTAKDLQKATNNYHESRILGQGGQGTVYKGLFPDNRVVAIKKSTVTERSQVEQFINELHILSQINHRNVVKLLGCCLETEVPLLVYEFVTNGNLSSHIHDTNCTSSLSWETYLQIASETAGALSYLHSSASTPIIHRDVKSTNVLLDDNFVAKISDFGASRFVPLDQTQVATMVQGTFGYLDPEYLHSGQLTDKSDVYSFGVLLAELLTRKKVICFDRPGKERYLPALFHSAVKEDRLLEVLDNRILNKENVQYFVEVAMLADRCLKVKGQERPTMREVAMELESILKLKEKHPWVEGDWSLEETTYLLNESLKIPYDCESSNKAGYDSLKSEVKLNIDSGR